MIKEGDLLEFELTAERALRVTVMKSSTVTRKPKKIDVPGLQASQSKKKVYRPMPELSRSMMLTGHEGVAMSDLLIPAAAAAAAQGLPIRLPDVSATQARTLSSMFYVFCPAHLMLCQIGNDYCPALLLLNNALYCLTAGAGHIQIVCCVIIHTGSSFDMLAGNTSTLQTPLPAAVISCRI